MFINTRGQVMQIRRRPLHPDLRSLDTERQSKNSITDAGVVELQKGLPECESRVEYKLNIPFIL